MAPLRMTRFAPKQTFARDLRRTFGVSPTYTEINAKLQADALRLGHGEVNFLSADERRRPARPTMRCSAARGSCGSNRRSHDIEQVSVS
jgi:hypothetical protein